MNERIKDLAKQATEEVMRDTPSFLVTNEIWKEKFAELIVLECAYLVGGYVKENEFGPPSDVKEAYEEITKHFGVEE